MDELDTKQSSTEPEAKAASAAASPAASTVASSAASPAASSAASPALEKRGVSFDFEDEDDGEEESVQDFVARYRSKPKARPAASASVDAPVAVPFLGPPKYRKFLGDVAGDAGFDPMGICTDVNGFLFYREAELKHCRLAMLAATGWPMSELFQPMLADMLLRDSDLAPGGRAPSVLNGGLDVDVVPGFMVVALASAIVTDLSKQMNPGSVGSYGFDPLQLEGWTPPVLGGLLPEGKQWMAEAELKHGRVAMLAITSFVIQEFVTKVPVVKETPFFFGRF